MIKFTDLPETFVGSYEDRWGTFEYHYTQIHKEDGHYYLIGEGNANSWCSRRYGNTTGPGSRKVKLLVREKDGKLKIEFRRKTRCYRDDEEKPFYIDDIKELSVCEDFIEWIIDTITADFYDN